MSISNLLVVPDPVNSPFYFSGEALILVFTITPSEPVVWDMASGTKGQAQSILATTSLHYPLLKNDIKNVMQTLLLTSLRSSQRDIFPVPCPCMLPKQKCRLYFLYLPLANSSNVGDTLCSQWYGQRQKIHQLVPKTWSKSNDTPTSCHQGH